MKFVYGFIFALISFPVFAVDYNVTANWVDPTSTGPDYTPQYDVAYRVNGGADTQVDDLSTPSWSGVITANASDNIEVRVRAENAQGPITGPWTTYTSAIAPTCLTVPAGQTGLNINVQCQ